MNTSLLDADEHEHVRRGNPRGMLELLEIAANGSICRGNQGVIEGIEEDAYAGGQ